MNAAIRKVTLVLALAFGALFVNLNVVQLGRSTELAEHPSNPRQYLQEFTVRRGEILAADGTVLAESVETKDDRYPYRRRYPLEELFGHITGYWASSFFCGNAGLERFQDAYLTGEQPATTQSFVDELLGRERAGNVIQITIDPRVQEVARKALGDQKGSVAAIDPRTGAVLALYANPAYNPNQIARHGPEDCIDAKEKLDARPNNPLLFRATQERFPPGSTFKILVSAGALEAGYTPGSPIPARSSYQPPGTDKSIRNYDGGACGGTLLRSLEVSCNTAFAYIGAELVKPKPLTTMVRKFGLDSEPDFDIEATVSCFVAIPGAGCSRSILEPAFVAQSSIGQYNVRTTALQMASVGATVAAGGRVAKPYLVQRVLDPAGGILVETTPEIGKRIYKKSTAESLKQMLVSVVRFGTGAVVGFSEASSGIIGGKTGTAQTGTDDPPHVWFVAFAPDVAVAVVVENGGVLGSEATGGRVAGPIAKAVLEKVRALNRNVRETR
ncbi:MAG TPA: penicillin-binding transpeptidase domain-containing protein [Actinomycetota bacterium]